MLASSPSRLAARMCARDVQGQKMNPLFLKAARKFRRFAAHEEQRSLSTAADCAVHHRMRRELLDFFPAVVEDMKAATLTLGTLELSERMQKLLEYTAPTGQLIRASAVLHGCRQLTPAHSSASHLYLAWAVELLHASYLIVDDICDGASVRRGATCWHRLPSVANDAIFDSFLVERAGQQLLQRHFRLEPCYPQLMELFSDTTFHTSIGQLFDADIKPGVALPIDHFSKERWKAQARAKTAFYTFYTPTAAAMFLAKIADPERHQLVWEITSDIGILFTVQDDFLDCYSAEDTGKGSTDIQNGKCTWLVVEALRRANPAQLVVLKKNYGQADAAKVAAVMEVYSDLGVREAAVEYQKDAVARLAARIDRQEAVAPALFDFVLDSVRRRVPG